MTEQIKAWLAGFEDLGAPGVDVLGPGEGWAIFPQGGQVLERKTDILGVERLRLRFTWLLRLNRQRDHRGDDPGFQSLLERLALWVRQSPPVLGREQTVRLEGSRLSALGKSDMARYEGKLIFEFTR